MKGKREQTIETDFESDFFQCYSTSLRARGPSVFFFTERERERKRLIYLCTIYHKLSLFFSFYYSHLLTNTLSHTHTYTNTDRQTVSLRLSLITVSLAHSPTFSFLDSLTHKLTLSLSQFFGSRSRLLSCCFPMHALFFYDYYSHSRPH